MGSYFYGYIEWQDDNGEWHLMHNPKEPNKVATYVVQGHLRDLLIQRSIGRCLRMKIDDTYKKPEPIKKYGIIIHPQDKKLVDEPLSAELTEIINNEFDPERVEEGEYLCQHEYNIITILDLTSEVDEEIKNALKRIEEIWNCINKEEIDARLKKIEMYMKFISEGKSPNLFKNLGASLPEEEEYSYDDDDIDYYKTEVLNYDVGQLNMAAGCLAGVGEMIGEFGADTDKVRFVACID